MHDLDGAVKERKNHRGTLWCTIYTLRRVPFNGRSIYAPQRTLRSVEFLIELIHHPALTLFLFSCYANELGVGKISNVEITCCDILNTCGYMYTCCHVWTTCNQHVCPNKHVFHILRWYSHVEISMCIWAETCWKPADNICYSQYHMWLHMNSKGHTSTKLVSDPRHRHPPPWTSISVVTVTFSSVIGLSLWM